MKAIVDRTLKETPMVLLLGKCASDRSCSHISMVSLLGKCAQDSSVLLDMSFASLSTIQIYLFKNVSLINVCEPLPPDSSQASLAAQAGQVGNSRVKGECYTPGLQRHSVASTAWLGTDLRDVAQPPLQRDSRRYQGRLCSTRPWKEQHPAQSIEPSRIFFPKLLLHIDNSIFIWRISLPGSIQ